MQMKMISGLERCYCGTDRGERSTRRKTYPVPLCPPKILHGLTWARTHASAVTEVIVKDSVNTAQQTHLVSVVAT